MGEHGVASDGAANLRRALISDYSKPFPRFAREWPVGPSNAQATGESICHILERSSSLIIARPQRILEVKGGEMTERDIREATIAGSVLRLRPKLMTVSVVMAGLVPILWSAGVGSDIMKPIAAPIVGGMITSTIHVLIITPVIFYIMKVRALRKGRLQVSGMTL